MCPRFITEKNKVFSLYKNQFCLLWKPDRVIIKKVIGELKSKYTIVIKCTSLDKCNSFCEYDSEPKKIESQLTFFCIRSRRF